MKSLFWGLMCVAEGDGEALEFRNSNDSMSVNASDKYFIDHSPKKLLRTNGKNAQRNNVREYSLIKSPSW